MVVGNDDEGKLVKRICVVLMSSEFSERGIDGFIGELGVC